MKTSSTVQLGRVSPCIFATIATLAALAIAAPEIQAGPCTPPPNGLVGWWPGEGNANDIIGGDNGMLEGGASFVSGKVGLGFRLDGTNGYVQIPDAAALKPTNVTVEAWVWLDPNVPTSNNEQILFKQNTWSYFFEGYTILKVHIDNGDGTFSDHFQSVVSRNGDQVAINSTTAVQRGVWYHVATTYDGNQLTLYVNGVAEASAIAGFALDYGTEPVFIGTTGVPGNYINWFAGIIDEVSIYSRALSTNEIAAIYNAGSAGKCAPGSINSNCVTPPSGLRGWWPGNGNLNDVINGDNALVNTGTVTYAPAEVGQGFYFADGANGLSVPDSTNLNFGAGQDFSIDAWIQPNPASRTFGIMDIVDKRYVPGYYNLTTSLGYTLYLVNGQMGCQLSQAPVGAFSSYGPAGPDLRDGQFHHVAMTVVRNSSTGGTLYVDGQPVLTFDPTTQPGDLSNTQPLLIGNHPDPGINGYFYGVIDEVSVYGRALSTNEIAAIYNAGSAGKCAPGSTTNNCVTPPSGLVSWWPAEGNANDIISGNNGLAQNVTYTGGEVGGAFYLNGSNAEVVVPASASLDVGAGSGFTFETWINPINVNRQAVAEWNDGEGDIGVHLFITESQYPTLGGGPPGCIYANLIDTSGLSHVLSTGGGVIISNSYQHIALTYDKASGNAVLYCNGNPVQSSSLGTFTSQTSYDFHLGVRASGSFSGGYFGGAMDEPSLYNRALTAAEIQSIYNAGSAGKCLPASSGCVDYTNFDDITGLSLVGSALVTNGVLRLTPANTGQTGDAWLSAKQPCASGFDSTFHFAISQLGNDLGNEPGGDGFTFAVQNLGPTNFSWAMGDTNQFVAVFFNTFWNWPGCTCPDVSDNSVGILINQTYIAQTDLNPLGINMSDGATHLARVHFDGAGFTVWVDGVMILTNVAVAGLAPGVDSSGQGWVGFTAGTGDAFENHDILDWSFCLNGNAPPTSGVPAISNFTPAVGAEGTVVTISGNNFSPSIAGNIVYFGAVRAVVLAASPTTLTVTVPEGATFAPITVAVNGLIAYAQAPFLATFNGGGTNSVTTLAPRLDLPTGDGPGFTAFADLDGDGLPDLLVLSGNIVSIYQNMGTNGTITAGSFAQRLDLSLPAGMDAMTVADVDGDGRLDIVLLNNASNQVMILKNLAAPGLLTTNSFAAPVVLSTGNDPRGLAVQDLDGDGRPELIVGNWADSTVWVYHNTGAGGITTNSFAAPVMFDVGANPQGLAVADLDGDGQPDIVTANNNSGTDSSVSILRNISSLGYIAFASHVDLAGLATSFCVAIGDLDGDGKLDLAVSSFASGQAVSIYRNTSTPGSITTSSFAAHVDFSTGGWGNSVAIGDLDGDGKPDLAVVTQLPDHLSIFKNISTPGSFTTGSLAARVDYATGWNPNGVAIGDLDGDGRPDIAFAVTYAATVSIYQNQTPLALTPPATNPPVITVIQPQIGRVGDSIGIFGTNFSPVAASDIVYFGAVRATVLSASPTNLLVMVPVGATYAPVTVTVNGLVAYSSAPFEPTFAGTGAMIDSSTFDTGFNLPTPSGPYRTAIADLDGDGRPDVIVIGGTVGMISIYQNVGSNGVLNSGTFAPPVEIPVGNNCSAAGLAVADVNGDGKLDLVVSDNINNQLAIFLNQSAGGALTTNSFAAPVYLPTGTDPRQVVVRDLDGDGLPDIVNANAGSGAISIFRNLGSTGLLTSNSFAPRVDLVLAGTSESVAVGDLDGDGLPDLAVADSTGYISLFRNHCTPGNISASTFDSRVDLPAQSGSLNVVIGDLDGDGKPELITSAYLPETMSVYRNLATPGSLTTSSFASPVDYGLDGRGHNIALADFNGDGMPDIAEVTELNSALSLFQNIGSGSFTSASLAARVDFSTGWNAWGIAVGDLDGDGRPDVVFANSYDSTITIYHNQMPVAATPPATTPPVITSISPAIAVPGSLIIIAGTNFSATAESNIVCFGAVRASVSTASSTSLGVIVPVGATFAPVSVTVGGLSANSSQWFEPTFVGDGSSISSASFSASFNLGTGYGSSSAVIADLDGDGKPDIALVSAGYISIFRNISTNGAPLSAASFAPRVDLPYSANAYRLRVVDLDGDGKLDLIACEVYGSNVTVFHNISTPGILTTNSFESPFKLPTGNDCRFATAADLDGDGRVDIVALNYADSTISILRNIGTAGSLTANSFAPAVTLACPGGPYEAVLADLHGDGKPDIAVANVDNLTVSIFQNVATPGSITTNSFALCNVLSAPDGSDTITAVDLDGDGILDLVIGSYKSETVSVFRSLGPDGSPLYFDPRVDFSTGDWTHTLGIADFNGDGRPDVGVVGELPSTLSIFQNLSAPGSFTSSSFAPRVDFGTGWNAWGMAAGDLNGDGRPDIVFCNFYDSNIQIYQNSTPFGVASNCVTVPSGSVAWWPGEGNALDAIGTNNGTLENGVNFAAGKVGQAFVFAGVGQGVQLGNPAALQLQDFTIEAWIQRGNASVSTLEPEQTTAAFLDYGYGGYGLGIYDDGSLFLTRVGIDNVTISSLITDTNWHHVAVTKAGTGVVFYVDGVSYPAPSPYTSVFTFDSSVAIGARGDNLANSFLGSIDEPSVYNRALTPVEIQSIYLAGGAGKCPVPTPPLITRQPVNQVVLLGGTATFSVEVIGSEPLSYLWRRNGSPIAGATNASYSWPNAQLADSGSQFSCLVTNTYGFAISTNVSLKVIDTIANDLCSGAIVISNAVYTNVQSTLKASSFGDPMPDCIDGFGHGVWYQFTAPAAGLLLVDTLGSDFDTGLAIYTGSCDALTEVACNDDFGGVTSQVAISTLAGSTYFILAGGYDSDAGNLVLHLNHLTPPAFVIEPTNLDVVVGSNATFATSLTGTLPMGFQWYFNNTPLSDNRHVGGSQTPTLIISRVQTNDAGGYQLVASNVLGVVTSSIAVLTPIILPPVITQQPVDQSVLAGSNVTFSVTVAGTSPYFYQWFFNGAPLTDDGIHIFGSSTNRLSIVNLTTADAGGYSLLVTNVSGSTNSISAMLTVLVPPSITQNPVGRSVPPGLPTTFNAAATGIPAPAYQWQLNGTNIPGATGSSYTIGAVGTNDLGIYHFVASNSVGSSVSADVQLTFGPVAAWGLNSSGECLPPPGLSNVVAVAGNRGASFALRTDGAVVPWGSGTATNLPATATNVAALATSDGNPDFALRLDGSVIGWPNYSAPMISNIVSIASGDGFAYGLRAEGTLTNFYLGKNIPLPGGLNHITAIACGFNSVLALRSDGTVVVAGTDGVTNPPAGLTNVVAVAAGYSFAMALKADGKVVAWGSGSGTNLPAGMTNIVAITAGNYIQENSGLAIRADGTLLAWGDNVDGDKNPPAALSNLDSIAAAAPAFHALALVNDGRPVILHPPVGLTAYTGRDVTLHGDAAGAQPLSYQWLLNGTNLPGATSTSLVISNVQFNNAGGYQLFVSNRIGTALSLAAPLTVVSSSALTFLSVPVAQTNYQGSKVTLSTTVLGSGPLRYQWYFSPTNNDPRAIYAAVPGATNDTLVFDPALAINTGNYYVAASNQFSGITSPPAFLRVLFARAWGYQAVTNPPVNVTNAIALAMSYGQNNANSYFALGANGKLTAWSGLPTIYGETNVAALSNSFVTAVAAGQQDVLALKSDGTVYAWGYGLYGQTNPPTGLNSVIAIACGAYHDLALKADGTVTGWGGNTQFNYGQATNNPAATNVVAIAAAQYRSMALRADGTVVSWGFGSDGTAVIPLSATNVIAITGGTAFNAALRADGKVVQWGTGMANYPVPANLSNVVAISGSSQHCTALKNDGTVVSWGVELQGPASNNVPADLANVIAITSAGEQDMALFGTRAPAFTVQPWDRSVPVNAKTNITLAAKCAGVQPVYFQWQLNGTNVPGATNDTLILTNQPLLQFGPLYFIPTGAYQLVASNAYGVVASKYAKVTTYIPLGIALDATNLVWTSTGNALWFGETNVTHDGVDAAQSGGIGALQETILQTTVGTNWSGRYTFWWKVSSEQDFDFLEFRLNGITQMNISGLEDWQLVSIPVTTGTNVLQWRYYKDATFDFGLDAGWVDQFSFIPDPPLITLQPVSQTVNMGTNVTLSVAASGPLLPQVGGLGGSTLIYRWSQNGNPIGGNNPLLTLNNVGRAQNGSYSVTVTNFLIPNNSIISSNAVLKVLVPQLLGAPVVLSDGTFQLTSRDADGGLLSQSDLDNFEAQASTNLVDWVPLPEALSLTNGMLLLQDKTTSNQPTRFYRLLEK